MIDIALDSDAVYAALLDRADQLCAALEAQVVANLSGEVLNMRSGALVDSISSDLEDDGSQITATVESSGVPYAGILEYGGKTAAHDIVAVKAKALAFMAGGALRFAKLVHHPGSLIRAYAYMGSALEALSDDIEGGLKDAVIEAVGAE
jgi:phage gpG-like protein